MESNSQRVPFNFWLQQPGKLDSTVPGTPSINKHEWSIASKVRCRKSVHGTAEALNINDDMNTNIDNLSNISVSHNPRARVPDQPGS